MPSTARDYVTKSKSHYRQTEQGKWMRGKQELLDAVYVSVQNAQKMQDYFNEKTTGVTEKDKKKQFALQVIAQGKKFPYSKSGGKIVFYIVGDHEDFYVSSAIDRVSPKFSERLSEDGIQNILPAPDGKDSDSLVGSGSALEVDFADSAAPLPRQDGSQQQSLVKQANQASKETMEKYGSEASGDKREKKGFFPRFSIFGKKKKKNK